MRLLVDTHALIWFLAGDARLPVRARREIESPEAAVLVSAASAMEVATKYRLGKLPQAAQMARDFESIAEANGLQTLPITVRHALLAGNLRIERGDPFDRFLIAQSLVEDLTLVSNETLFDEAGVMRLW